MTEDSRISRLEASIEGLRDRVTAIETKSEAIVVHRANVERRLSNIESGQTWIIRLIFGAIITALLGFMLQGGLSL